jgi:hypothetical protein
MNVSVFVNEPSPFDDDDDRADDVDDEFDSPLLFCLFV